MTMNHKKYIEEKEKRTIELYNEQMIQGKIFDYSPIKKIERLTGTFADFTDSEQSMTVKTNINSTKQTENTKDQSAQKNNIQPQKPIKHTKEDKS